MIAAHDRLLVLLNPHAHGGRSAKTWRGITPIIQKTGALTIYELSHKQDLRGEIQAAVDQGYRRFVAAGGDGTVGALVNAIAEAGRRPPLSDFTIGAVGLGSSNDFHKPYGRTIHGIPVRLDFRQTTPRDLAFAEWSDANGSTHCRYFLISGGVGFVAEANDFFSSSDPLQSVLRKYSTPAAIAWAVIRTLSKHTNHEMTISDGSAFRCTKLTNLSVMKTPFVSGSLKYDVPVAQDNRLLSICLCEHMSFRQKALVVVDLLRGRFAGRANRDHLLSPTFSVSANVSFPLELDGEIDRACRVQFSVGEEQVNVCR